ncbi:DUF3888 domain-containing protein [Cytobacillus kochii]|nr:DUF3888 domain-containing protein [Cytobacillus kochii]MCA1028884.1 DUF3888 domain-containing protein [Cytobacillus kochii]MCM3324668.1 DUF3888 domain-containing protein [Cytobacillus kochii]MCM3347127.1 DUF3888 domain-containing protein [Cytobacillus kochii]MDM5205639.1 DUF3888 domain-containing protein [Cytobacillus kochii]
MKSKILIALLGIYLFTQPLVGSANVNSINNENLYDSYLTLLNPYVYKIINEKVGTDRSYDLFDAKIISIKRNVPGETPEEKEVNKGVYDFTVKVQYRTFVGAHNPPLGLETLTLRVTPNGVKLLDFNHKDL